MRDEEAESWIRAKAPDISLRDIVAPLFRRKRILIATFLVALTVVILAGLLMPPQYTSHMAILVNRERLDPLVTTGSPAEMIATSTAVPQEEIHSEAQLLKSRDVLEKVALANGLENQHGNFLLDLLRPKQDKADGIERAVRSLAKKIEVDTGTETNLIEVTYSSPKPLLSYGVLKALGDLYMEKHEAVHRPPGSYKFFAQETQNYRQALQDSETRLRSFHERQGAAAPDLERSDLALQVTAAGGRMQLAQEAVAADLQRIRSDKQQMEKVPQRSSTLQSSSPADKLLSNLVPVLVAAETKRTQLAMIYDPSYPLVHEADEEVATAKAAVAAAEKTRYVTLTTDRDPAFDSLREDLVKTTADLAAQRAGMAAIQKSIQSLQNWMVNLDQNSLTEQDLLRDMKANEGNYLLYLSKQEQERTTDALDKTRIENVAIAVPPDIPALPAHGFPIFVLVGLILASALAVVMAYLVEYFDSSFHTPAQVIDMLGIPVVVAVPRMAA